jgi:hypothetical protein
MLFYYSYMFRHVLPEDGTNVPKHVRVVKDNTFKCVFNVSIKLVL